MTGASPILPPSCLPTVCPAARQAPRLRHLLSLPLFLLHSRTLLHAALTRRQNTRIRRLTCGICVQLQMSRFAGHMTVHSCCSTCTQRPRTAQKPPLLRGPPGVILLPAPRAGRTDDGHIFEQQIRTEAGATTRRNKGGHIAFAPRVASLPLAAPFPARQHRSHVESVVLKLVSKRTTLSAYTTSCQPASSSAWAFSSAACSCVRGMGHVNRKRTPTHPQRYNSLRMCIGSHASCLRISSSAWPRSALQTSIAEEATERIHPNR